MDWSRRASRETLNTHHNYCFIAPILKAINFPLLRYIKYTSHIIAPRGDGYLSHLYHISPLVWHGSCAQSICLSICRISEMRVESEHNFLVYVELTESTFLELQFDMFFCKKIYIGCTSTRNGGGRKRVNKA